MSSASAQAIVELAVTLRAARVERGRMHDALVAVARGLEAETSEDDRRLREATRIASGLSAEMVRFALRTSAGAVTHEAIARLFVSTLGRTPVGLAGIVLAGNVTSAAIRALTVPLALGVPLLVKASSRDAVVAHAFRDRLARLDPSCGAMLAVVDHPGGDVARDEALVARCDVVHVYGSDATIAAYRALADERTVFAHGHGFGVGVVGEDADVGASAEAFALDVAAYDQRGCLSPHAIYVVGDAARRRRFAEALAVALERVEMRLPRGPLDDATHLAWNAARALAVMEGAVIEGATSLVACTDVFRGSPLGRFVRVLRADGSLDRALAPNAQHLTCIGVAGTMPAHETPARAVVVPAGTMQLPALDADVDGRPCTEGFFSRTKT